jgi:hypothetical protein
MLAINISIADRSRKQEGNTLGRVWMREIWQTWLSVIILPSLLLVKPVLLAQSPGSENEAEQTFQAARARWENARTNPTNGWQLGRAAYDLADLLQDDRKRKDLADAGAAACRQALSLQPDSAPAHYYLALDLGQAARARKLGALKLLREMEQALLRAAELDPKFDYAGPDRSLGLLYLEAPPWPASVGNRNKARAHLETAAKLEPEYPENRLSLAEAYAHWGELRNLEHELEALDQLWPKARATFASEAWAGTWKDWEKRRRTILSLRDRLGANPRPSAAERGARPAK